MSAVILLRRWDGRLILTRQFRAPVLLDRGDGSLIECRAGGVDAERAVRCKAAEETSLQVDTIRHLFTLY